MVRTRAGGDVPLVPTCADVFFDGRLCFYTFLRDSRDTVNGVRVSTDRIRALPFARRALRVPLRFLRGPDRVPMASGSTCARQTAREKKLHGGPPARPARKRRARSSGPRRRRDPEKASDSLEAPNLSFQRFDLCTACVSGMDPRVQQLPGAPPSASPRGPTARCARAPYLCACFYASFAATGRRAEGTRSRRADPARSRGRASARLPRGQWRGSSVRLSTSSTPSGVATIRAWPRYFLDASADVEPGWRQTTATARSRSAPRRCSTHRSAIDVASLRLFPRCHSRRPIAPGLVLPRPDA